MLCLLLCGCAGPKLPPPSTLHINLLDTQPLKGKIIVLDPGHGGTEQGAIGPNGLKEAEVNLGVALYLWGLLHQAGAQPILTRSADNSVYTGTPFALDKDLDARSAVSNQNNADLFISIHHNSDTNNQHRNDVQIYYKMVDTGPSRDIAKSILQALMKRLRVSTGNIYSGNYRVLRMTRAPAILGESSFISNKNNEDKLSLQRTLQAEAEGYFAGILSYYQTGVPEIIDLYPRDITVADARPEISARIVSGTGKQALNPETVIFMLDGEQTIAFSLKNNSTISYLPPYPLENRDHAVCISARNLAGNSSRETCASFIIAVPAAAIEITPAFPAIPPDGIATTAIDVTVLDHLKRPVVDGTKVTFKTSGGRLLESEIMTKQGRARTILVASEKQQSTTITATAGSIIAQTSVRFGVPRTPLLLMKVTDDCGTPVAGACVIHRKKEVSVSDEKGCAYVKANNSGITEYTIIKKGFFPYSLKARLISRSLVTKDVTLKVIDGGVFFNKKIMLDPAGSSQQTFPLLNELKKKIEYAGGTVFFTWQDEPPQSLKKRVIEGTRVNADLFLTVEITSKTLAAEYYYKSEQGKLMADGICNGFLKNRSTKTKKCLSVDSTNYLLVQTSMPALWLKIPQKLLQQPSIAASVIYQGIVDFYKTKNVLNKVTRTKDSYALHRSLSKEKGQ
jgi:N-acetylmuramoyl-L-alanine amidase